MPVISELTARVKTHYDRIAAFLTLVVLLVSLVYLAVHVGLAKRMQQDFDQSIRSLRPAHPHAKCVQSDLFDRAIDTLEAPIMLNYQTWSNGSVLVPESRMSCPDCRRPVPVVAKTCPHCGGTIEKAPPVLEDSDGDGMKDVWEVQHGFDRFDASDAQLDRDEDGFTNLEEYVAQTSPVSKEDHPPSVAKLRVVRIDAEPFRLQFKSRIKTSDGSYKFGLNYRTRRDTKTTFAKLGETVEGFTLTSYEAKEKMVEKPFKRKMDVSELTLERGQKKIILVKGQARLHLELTAVLQLLTDESEYSANQGDTIELDGIQYRVIDIDRETERVVLLSELKKARFTIDRTSAERVDARK